MSYSFKELFKNPSLENTFRYLGESKHGATLIACSIAVFKGFFRPLFTLMDKKSDPESKKYAAFREGLTEVAAFPLYAVTPWVAGKLVDSFSKEGNALVKDRMKGNAKFFGICAATLIIPAVCNMIQPPIMAEYKRRQEAKKAKMIQEPTVKPAVTINQPAQTFSGRINYGMRVGN